MSRAHVSTKIKDHQEAYLTDKEFTDIKMNLIISR